MKTGLLQESLPVCLTFAWNRRGGRTREELHLQQPSEMRSAPAIRMPGLIMKKFIYMSLVVF